MKSASDIAHVGVKMLKNALIFAAFGQGDVMLSTGFPALLHSEAPPPQVSMGQAVGRLQRASPRTGAQTSPLSTDGYREKTLAPDPAVNIASTG